jgi:hypothetical protein
LLRATGPFDVSGGATNRPDFLTKPIDAPRLRRTLVRLIGHRDNDRTRS